MKLLLVILAVVVLLWLLRGTFGTRKRADVPTRPTLEPKAMVRCAECGLHLPRDEALPGKHGVFCSDAHRAEFEAHERRDRTG